MQIKDFISIAADLFSTFAKLTPTSIDDEILEFLQAVEASPELLEWVEGLFDEWLSADEPQVLHYAASVPPNVQAAFTKSAAGWLTVVRVILPLLFDIYMSKVANK